MKRRNLYTRFRSNPAACARHLVETKGNGADLYARDREDTCRTEAESIFWHRVGDALAQVSAPAPQPAAPERPSLFNNYGKGWKS